MKCCVLSSEGDKDMFEGMTIPPTPRRSAGGSSGSGGANPFARSRSREQALSAMQEEEVDIVHEAEDTLSPLGRIGSKRGERGGGFAAALAAATAAAASASPTAQSS